MILWAWWLRPRKLTCPLKRDYFNRKYIFQPSFFRDMLVFRWVCPTCRKSLLSPTFETSSATCCWWFRNPAVHHLPCIKPGQFRDIYIYLPYQLVTRISEPSTLWFIYIHYVLSFQTTELLRHLESLGTAASLIRRRTCAFSVKPGMAGNLQKVINCYWTCDVHASGANSSFLMGKLGPEQLHPKVSECVINAWRLGPWWLTWSTIFSRILHWWCY